MTAKEIVPPPPKSPATKASAVTEKTSEKTIPKMATYWAFSFKNAPEDRQH